MKELSEEVGFPYKLLLFFVFFQYCFFGWRFGSQVGEVKLGTVGSCALFTYPAGWLYFVSGILKSVYV